MTTADDEPASRFGSTAAFIADPTVHTVTVDGEAVIGDESNSRIHHLNAEATLLWRSIISSPSGRSIDDLVAVLPARPGVTEHEVRTATQQLLGELLDLGLLRTVDRSEGDGS